MTTLTYDDMPLDIHYTAEDTIEYVYRLLDEVAEDLYQSDLRLLKECFRLEKQRIDEEVPTMKDVVRKVFSIV